MKYRNDRHGEPISQLGYGCMRFSHKGAAIDIDKTEKEILKAFRAGINYYDTAYVYPGSEAALGEILERNGIREQVKIATKLPQYMISKAGAIDKDFNEELVRLRTTWIDYYLMHMITDLSQWRKMESLGIREWIDAKKASGQIRNIGFSFHGNSDMFIEVLNAYDWDFCQIQYNYLDEMTQAGRKGLEAAYAKGIPVIIMEPLRGGKLVNLLPEDAKKRIAADERGWSAAEWSFRWLWNQPGVTCVLSGMNSEEMVEENIRIASEASVGDLTERDLEVIEQLKDSINAKTKVGCTACRYCMPCPKGVRIPDIFRCYNRMYTENKLAGRLEYAQTVSLQKDPGFATDCVRCGKCEQHCPQSLPIRDLLVEADKALRPLPVKVVMKAAAKFMLK
ncbi:MAG: aldo/keto reductase [Eubacterium sp.]|nr:aldo/keto reductase [Eubacterium sp.]